MVPAASAAADQAMSGWEGGAQPQKGGSCRLGGAALQLGEYPQSVSAHQIVVAHPIGVALRCGGFLTNPDGTGPGVVSMVVDGASLLA